jgi:hypothetical protein
MSIDFKNTEKLLYDINEYLQWEDKQKKRSKKVNNLKKKIYENCKK